MPTIRHDTLPLNGLDLHVAQVGSGPPLLLLHGWPEFWLTWEPVMTRLSERFTCITPDLRGFGRTGKPDAGLPIGIGGVRAVAAATVLPCAAIGGIGLENLARVRETGAPMAAVISALIGDDPEAAARALVERWG